MSMRALSYGGGTDSTGIIAGWVERGLQENEPIDAIVFADTGNERPHTYEHIERMQSFLQRHGLPPITIVKKGGRRETLEEYCLRTRHLPSLAYGFKSCSHKFKIEPQEKHFNNLPAARATWKAGGKVEKMIGYEFREQRRWAKAKLEDEKYVYRFPLVEWEWNREHCVQAMRRVGIAPPGKSSCFFCPASKKHEIDELQQTYPMLFHRAIAIEDNARVNFKSIKGLGRNFSWRDYATTKEEPVVSPCMACVDGEESDDEWMRT